MFIRPELRKGDIDVRIKAPRDLVEKFDLISAAFGVTRQDVVLLAMDAYATELAHVSKVLAPSMERQRSRNGGKGERQE